ncbi:MAG: alkaline phosphatase family protein [Acidobacteria bacterium]|nr:alkaline phosphatase family protein [Acidobacteriota bacterium]
MRRSILIAVAAGAAVLLLVALGLRSLPSAAAGQVLVLSDAAHAGPIRVLAAPWAPRRVVGRVEQAELDLGGAELPLHARAALRVDPAALDEPARNLLLSRGGFPGWLRARLESSVPAAAAKLGRAGLVANAGAIGPPLRAELAAALPRGLVLESFEIAAEVAPEEARAAVIAAARPALRPPLARVLYVGLDGADWMIADPLLARGEMPNLARLVRDGVRADLQSYEPIMSPMLWTTAITGRPPDQHQICDFTVDDEQGEQVPITSGFRKAATVWEILDAAGQPSGFANFWATHPVEEFSGVLVSDAVPALIDDARRPAGLPASVIWPPAFASLLLPATWTTESVPAEAVRELCPVLTDAEIAEARHYWRDPALRERYRQEHSEGRKTPLEALLLKTAVRNHNLELVAQHMLAEPRLGLVAVYFREPDEIGHNFQHLAPPLHPLAPPEERRFSGVVDATYRALDAMLGRLVEAAGPETVVIVHSDHGFETGGRRPPDILPFMRGQPVEWHRPLGIFVASGGPVRRGVDAGTVTLFDIAPTLLALRGVPPAQDMQGAVRADLLRDEFAPRTELRRIPSWDALLSSRKVAGAGEGLGEAREQMVEALRGLGYVEDSGPRPRRAAPAGEARAGGERPRATYYRNLATYLMNANRFAEAEAALASANEIEPLPKTYWLISEARAARGDFAGARAALEDGFAKLADKMTPASLLWLVELELKQQDVAGAEQALARWQSIAVKQPAVIAVARGRIAESRGDPVAARQSYLEALAADPREARAAERLAALAATPQDRAALEPYLRAGLARDNRIEIYWQMLGLILAERGDVDGAAEAFLRAAELEPDNEGYQLNAGAAALRAGRRQDARRIYERLARGGSRQPGVWVNLGSLCASDNDWAGAARAWENALQLGADSPQLRASLEQARRRSR